jgi:hypothetical protein
MILTGKNRKDLEETLTQCQIVHQKSNIVCPGIEPGPRRLKTNIYRTFI